MRLFESAHVNKVFVWLFGANILLIICHLAFHYAELHGEISPFVEMLVRRFSMDMEASIPTWFATSLLLTVAAVAGVIGCSVPKKNKYKKHWWLFSAVFVYLSLDEAAEVHELLIEPVQNTLGIESGLLFFGWFIPVLAVAALIGLLLLKFFLQLPTRLKWQLVAAAVLFVSGAVGMEMISGSYWEARDFQYDMMYRIFNAIEEGLENTGSIVAISALYGYLATVKRK